MSQMWFIVVCLLAAVCLDASPVQDYFYNSEYEEVEPLVDHEQLREEPNYDSEDDYTMINNTLENERKFSDFTFSRFRKLQLINDMILRWRAEKDEELDPEEEPDSELEYGDTIEERMHAAGVDWDFENSMMDTSGYQNNPVQQREKLINMKSPKKQHLNWPSLATNMVVVHDYLKELQNKCNCKVPQPRLVSVDSVHANYTKQYLPHHILLHRCGDDGGYCSNPKHSCLSGRNETVYINVIVMSSAEQTTEHLPFTNHTECYCGTPGKYPGYPKRDGKTAAPIFKPTKIMETTSAPPALAPVTTRPSCKCTREFSVHITEDGQCACTCYSKHRDCLRLRKGREYFGLVDRMCIRAGQCQKPVCEFGEYLKVGRCPRRHERLNISSTASSRKRRNI